MRGLAHWCIARRRRVVVAWVAVAVLTTVLAGAVGRSYVTAYGLPGTDSQRAQNLLKQDFKTQSGDVDAVVFHVSNGTIESPAVRAAITPMLARVRTLPHVSGVISPYSSPGAGQVAANRMTAFATVNYDRQASRLANGHRQTAAGPGRRAARAGP